MRYALVSALRRLIRLLDCRVRRASIVDAVLGVQQLGSQEEPRRLFQLRPRLPERLLPTKRKVHRVLEQLGTSEEGNNCREHRRNLKNSARGEEAETQHSAGTFDRELLALLSVLLPFHQHSDWWTLCLKIYENPMIQRRRLT